MSSREIKAGGAFIELTLKEKYKADLTDAEKRFLHLQNVIEQRQRAATAASKAMLLATVKGLRQIGLGMVAVGTATAAMGAGIFAVLGKSVKTFLEVSKAAKSIGSSIGGAKAEKLNNAMRTFLAILGAIQFRIGEALAEPLTSVLVVLSRLGMGAANFIKNNQGLVVTMAALGAVLLVAGTALIALGTAFIFTASAISGAAAILAFIATPVGLIAAIVAALAAVLLLTAGAWVVMAETGTGAISGLLAAVASGNMLQAWLIITKGMEAMWNVALFGMEAAFLSMVQRIGSIADSMVQRIAKAMTEIERATGMNLGAGSALGRMSAIANIGATAGTNQAMMPAAFDMARAMQDLANISSANRANFMGALMGVNFKLPDLGKMLGGRQGFGVTGSTNSATAGMNRAMGAQLAEEKKHTEHLDNILKVLKGLKIEGGLEFAP